MRLILIRHGDPDYVHDTLTEKGWREANLLAKRVANWQVDDVYTSPLGRAKDTAAPCLKIWGKEAKVLEWAQEFYYLVEGDSGEARIPWDYFPADWTCIDENFHENHWVDIEVMRPAREKYEWVCSSLDSLLRDYGYERSGRYYRFSSPNPKTVVLFCHFGLASMVLSHLLNISAQTLLHGTFLAPTSVTVLNSEERQAGSAYFRVERMGDCAHLIASGEPISASGYFAEVMQETQVDPIEKETTKRNYEV